MIDRKRLNLILVSISIELIILSLLFTGLVIHQKNQLKSFNQIKKSNYLISLETSKNYIYAEDTFNASPISRINITKYDSNLQPISISNFQLDNPQRSIFTIEATTDQSILLLTQNDSTGYVQSYLKIADKNGLKPSLNITGFNTLSALPIGLNYFLVVGKLINSNKTLRGELYFSNGTIISLFLYEFDRDTQFGSPFFSSSSTIEIPFYTPIPKAYGLINPIRYNLFVNSSKIEYNINTKSISIVKSNFAQIYNEIENHIITSNQTRTDKLLMFPYNYDFLGLEIHLYQSKTNFNIWSDKGIIKEYTLKNPLFSNITGNIFSNLISSFQISYTCYLNLELTRFQSNKSESKSLLIFYSKYSLSSNFQIYNYSDIIPNGFHIVHGFAKKVKQNIVYAGLFGASNLSADFNYSYCIRIYKILTNFFDQIYQLPLFLKFLIGLIFIVPTAFFIIKRSKKVTPVSETYPLN